LIADACRALEVTAMNIFARNRWQLGFVACNLLSVYLSKFVIKAGYISLTERLGYFLISLYLKKIRISLCLRRMHEIRSTWCNAIDFS